jgi:hypothetical protein
MDVLEFELEGNSGYTPWGILAQYNNLEGMMPDFIDSYRVGLFLQPWGKGAYRRC